jgi:hypothetical protein
MSVTPELRKDQMKNWKEVSSSVEATTPSLSAGFMQDNEFAHAQKYCVMGGVTPDAGCVYGSRAGTGPNTRCLAERVRWGASSADVAVSRPGREAFRMVVSCTYGLT